MNSFCLENSDPFIYPNPVNTKLTIESPTDGVVVIKDVFERVVSAEVIFEGENFMNVSELNSGAYFIIFELVNNKSFVHKFVKM
ncbi:MAG: T9SS type A sorting domain-containing protein [Crocinitomicaceae bacterium]|nr:T9SS type A sorting domain-containing protein [Crocinitomicaceae bacterium]